MKTKSFVVGQIVEVKGKSGLFRYVKKNIVKEISSGKVCSVKISDIHKPVKYDWVYILLYLFMFVIGFAFGIFIISLLTD